MHLLQWLSGFVKWWCEKYPYVDTSYVIVSHEFALVKRALEFGSSIVKRSLTLRHHFVK
jgi:hypothetical protein